MEKRFDPMTGKPLGTPQGFDPATGRFQGGSMAGGYGSPQKKEKWYRKKGFKIACAAAAGVAVVAVAAVNLLPRLIFGKNYQVMQAFAGALSPNHLMEDLNLLDILEDGKYTVTMGMKAQGTSVDAAIASNEGKEMSVEANASYNGVEIGADAKIDSNEILLKVPLLSANAFRYGFTDNKNGYLIELLEDEGIDVKAFDKMMSEAFSGENKQEIGEIFADAAEKAKDLIDFEKSEKREIEIDGDEKKCQGYTMHLDQDVILDFSEIYEDMIQDYIGQVMENWASMGVDELKEIESEIKEGLQEIRNGANEINSDLTVYVYKKQLAGIILEDKREQVAILEFHGGSTPWENVTIKEKDGGPVIVKLSGSVEDDEESLQMQVQGVKVADYTYNYENGDFSLDIGDSAADGFSVDGNIKKSKDSFQIVLDQFEGIDDADGCSLELGIKKGADIVEISKDNTVDIGNLSEQVLEELVGKPLYSLIYGSGESYDDYDDGYDDYYDYDSYSDYDDYDYDSYSDYDDSYGYDNL